MTSPQTGKTSSPSNYFVFSQAISLFLLVVGCAIFLMLYTLNTFCSEVPDNSGEPSINWMCRCYVFVLRGTGATTKVVPTCFATSYLMSVRLIQS